MRRRPTMQRPVDPFEAVRTVGLLLPDVQAMTKYDGSPVLKVRGSFMAGLATHRSAEPDTLVVRVGFEEREWLPQLSFGARAIVADRPRGPARPAVRVMAPDGGEGAKWQPTTASFDLPLTFDL